MDTNLNNPNSQDNNCNKENIHQNTAVNSNVTLNLPPDSKTEVGYMQNKEANTSETNGLAGESASTVSSYHNTEDKSNTHQQYEYFEEIPIEELDEIGILKRIIISADKCTDLLDLALPRLSEFNLNCTNLPAQIHEIGLYSKTIFMMLEEEKKNREEFLNNIPKQFEFLVESVNSFKRSAGILKQLQYGIMGIFGLAILFVGICGYVGIKNYKIGIKTKEEHREEFIQELKDSGNTVIPQKDLSELRKNTKLIQQWIKKYPKESDSFMKFKEGYDLHAE